MANMLTEESSFRTRQSSDVGPPCERDVDNRAPFLTTPFRCGVVTCYRSRLSHLLFNLRRNTVSER